MKPKILAIDDSLTLREFIHRCLAKNSNDYQIVLAKDGTEGLSLAASESPDLILLDFLLPDMKGDKVCRRLLDNKKTADVPVVLMSSSAAEIKRTQAEFGNVVKAIAKPFTPEVLCSTVGFILRENIKAAPSPAAKATEAHAPAPVAAPASTMTATMSAAPEAQLCGDTGQFPIIDALLALEQDQSTGLLSVATGNQTIELHVVGGHPLLVTTRDVAAYLKSTPHRFTPPQTRILDASARQQSQTACPVFLAFIESKLMPVDEAVNTCHDHGLRLFASVWTTPRARFRFQAHAPLPPLANALRPYDGVMSEWAMETLRCVGDDFKSAMAWGEPTGIPAYTRRGYERIQQIPLNDEELAFAGFISPTSSLANIAASMKISVDDAQRILYRFLCLEIFDYWPASLLLAA
jgi:CheY-like chemotaxis protein